MKILYLLQQFPNISSEAFLLNEITELQAMGNDVWILADEINKIDQNKLHSLIIENDLMKKVISNNTYARGLFKFVDFLKTFFIDLISSPKKTLNSLFIILFQVPYFENKNIWSKFDNYLIIKRLLVINFDLVYAPFAHLEKIDRGLAIAKISKAKFATAFRALELYGKSCCQDIIKYKKLFKKIDAIITISIVNKQRLEELLGEDTKITIVHSSIDPDKFMPVQRNDSIVNKIICIARFIEKKGIIYLLEALHYLKNDGIKAELLLIGEGPMLTTYLDKIQELKIDELVKISRPINQELIKSALQESDIMVLPCIVDKNGDRDIMANVLKEAMATGIPVISSNISGIEELITDNDNGLLFPEKDSKALAEAIKKLIKNNELRETLSRNGREKIVNDFNVKKEVKKLNNIFLEITKS